MSDETERIMEATKREDGKDFPASDYAYVPDPDKPSTWKLRMTSEPGGPPDPRILGAAAAALGPGFRGNRVEIPRDALPAVKRKLRAAWRKAHPDADESEMPDVFREAAELEVKGDYVPLLERVVRPDDTITVKIIQPGWGTSGYYSPEVLQRDGSRVFRAGTHMYWNHQTPREAAERPEGDLRDLAGVLISDAVWRDGPAGPGLYADAKVFGQYRNVLSEIAPHIGVSIRGAGRAEEGERDGRRGKLISELTAAHSVDFVTKAGAGGKVLELFEAARAPQNTRQETNMEEQVGNERLAELESENARLRDALAHREAGDLLARQLDAAKLPDAARQRLSESLMEQLPISGGTLDAEAYRARVAEAIEKERAYIASLMPADKEQKPKIVGMGATDYVKPSPLFESFREMYRKLGKDDAEAERLAKIAAQGR